MSLILISSILVAGVFLPFFLIDRTGWYDSKKRMNQYKLAIAKNKLNITQKEYWGNSFIGIDTAQKKLLFMKVGESGNTVELLDLNRAKECRIVNTMKYAKMKTKKESLLMRLDLEVSFVGNDQPIAVLNFFDMNDIYKEDFEQQRGEKWKALINSYTSALIPSRKTA